MTREIVRPMEHPQCLFITVKVLLCRCREVSEVVKSLKVQLSIEVFEIEILRLAACKAGLIILILGSNCRMTNRIPKESNSQASSLLI